MIESEVNAKYIIMSAIMGEAAQLVEEGTDAPGCLDPCLRGSASDYVLSFEPFVQKKDANFLTNREELERQLQSADASRQAEVADLKESREQIQNQIERIFSEGQARIKSELKKLNNLGLPLTDHADKFFWPSIEDFEKMNLTEPLKLKSIKLKTWAGNGSSSGSIQLVFDKNIESPVFDCFSKYKNAEKEFTTEQLTGTNITRIVA